jgi:hypothetical protein
VKLRRPAVDGPIVALFVLGALFLAARGWLAEHPEHNPWAPLNLNDPPGWATHRKLAALRRDPEECRAVLARSGIEFTTLPPAGANECRREDRLVLGDFPLAPARPVTSCSVAAGLELWLKQLQPVARELLGTRVGRIEHFGSFSCRRVYGRESGAWSEHATGNALDVGAFVLADGRRLSVLQDWRGGDAESAFLHRARDAACKVFGTTLSPDYNAAHADHLHLDQAARGFGSVCR